MRQIQLLTYQAWNGTERSSWNYRDPLTPPLSSITVEDAQRRIGNGDLNADVVS